MDRNKAKIFEIDIKKRFDIDKFAFYDQNGEIIEVPKGDVNDIFTECIKNGNPIYAINKENGSVQPIISNGKDGNILAGNDEIANAPLKNVAIPAKPGLFARMFDSVLRTFGLEKYRSRDCIEYRKAIEQNRAVLERNKIITAAQNKVNAASIIPSKVNAVAKSFNSLNASKGSDMNLNNNSNVDEKDDMIITGDIEEDEYSHILSEVPDEPVVDNYQPSEESKKVLKTLQSSQKYAQASKNITEKDIDMALGNQNMQKESFKKLKHLSEDIKKADTLSNSSAKKLENKKTVEKNLKSSI